MTDINILTMPVFDIVELVELSFPASHKARPHSKPVVKSVRPKVAPGYKVVDSYPIRISPANSHTYTGRIIEYTSRSTKKNAIIKSVSLSGKTVQIQEIILNDDLTYTEVFTNDLKSNLEVDSRKIYLK